MKKAVYEELRRKYIALMESHLDLQNKYALLEMMYAKLYAALTQQEANKKK